MTYVKIELPRESATKEQKRALIKGITDLMNNVLNKNSQSTHVVIQEYDTDNWGHVGEGVPVPRAGYDC